MCEFLIICIGYTLVNRNIEGMVQTKDGVGTNPWIEFVRECAKEYKSTTQPAKEQAKGGHDTKRANGAKGGKGGKGAAMTKEEQTVKGGKDRQQEVYKKQSHANMKRSGEIAQKAEREQLIRKRLTTKQKDANMKQSGEIAQEAEREQLTRKRLTSKQKDPNSSI